MIVALAATIVLWDLDTSDGDFVSGGNTAQWEWGVPAAGPGGSERVWGTRLDGSYYNDAEDTLEIPLPDLSAVAAPVLVLRHWYEIGLGDSGRVEVDGGGGWTSLAPHYGYPTTGGFSGNSGGWVESSFDLSGLAAEARLRLVFASDLTVTDDGWYVSDVGIYDGDATPPRLTPVLVPGDTDEIDGPYRVEMRADDDVDVTGLTVWMAAGDSGFVAYPAAEVTDGVWAVELPGQAPSTVVRWYAEATDGNHLTRWPSTGETAFRVYLPAPTDLAGPGERVVGDTIELSWLAPTTEVPVLGYELIEVGFEEDPIFADETFALVPMYAAGLHSWRVAAVYDAGLGDYSDTLTLDVEIPELIAMEPELAWPEDRLRVDVRGSSLYLLEGTSIASLGEGITVESVDVHDANSATVLLALDGDAAAGPRDLTIAGAYGTYTFTDAFAVGDAADRPRIVDLDPGEIEQGWAGQLRIEASEPFAGPVRVDADDDLVVSEAVVDGGTATLEVVVSGRAATGTHLIVLDDGQRLWSAEIVVAERVLAPGRGCAAPVGGAPGAAALIALLAARRRRRG